MTFSIWSVAAVLALSSQQIPVRLSTDGCKTGTDFHAALARNDEERRVGLSGRSNPLAENEAMLFVYASPRPVSYWMKDTLIAMAIYFFDVKGRGLSSFKMDVEKDPANPLKTYDERKPASAALEVPQAVLKLYPKAKKVQLCIGK